MEFLLVLLVAWIVFGLIGRNTQAKFATKLVVQKKQCPPHQWFWQEITDQDGIKQGEQIVCKVCGPLAAQSGREDT